MSDVQQFLSSSPEHPLNAMPSEPNIKYEQELTKQRHNINALINIIIGVLLYIFAIGFDRWHLLVVTDAAKDFFWVIYLLAGVMIVGHFLLLFIPGHFYLRSLKVVCYLLQLKIIYHIFRTYPFNFGDYPLAHMALKVFLACWFIIILLLVIRDVLDLLLPKHLVGAMKD